MAYTILKGDTLSSIASKNNTTVDALAKANNITDVNKIQAGATLNFPTATTPAPVTPAPVSTNPGEQTQQQREAAFAAAGQRPVITPAPSAGPLSTSDLARGTSLPDASAYATTTAKAPLSAAVTQVAGSTLDATGKAIDGLLAMREADQKAAKDAAATKVAADESAIKALGDKQATASQDALAETRAKFNVDEQIKNLSTIQNKIASAQEALNMGLIYEADRPARESLLIGRSASLQKQGLATIGALQATAQIVQGNIDLAEAYAKTTISAITTDNKNAMDALNTLLGLHNDNLVTLTADEKSTLDARIKALTDQDAELKKNTTDVFDLMSKYPSAAIDGGVTLLDDRATAIAKMMPKMSAMELQKFNHDNAAKTGTGTDKDGTAENKSMFITAKNNGMTYEEALSWADVLSTDWINAVYREDNSVSDLSGTNALYGNFLNADGTPKDGYEVVPNPKGGTPIIQAKPAAGGDGFWAGLSNWWKGN